jgi:hypothetical protein
VLADSAKLTRSFFKTQGTDFLTTAYGRAHVSR